MRKIISTILVCVLLLGCVAALASCGTPDSDPKAAKAALEEEGYTVTLKENYGEYDATIFAYNNNIKEKKYDEITIYYFKDAAAANAAWDTLSEVYEKEAESKKGTDYEIEYGIDGKIIYVGTVDAVDAAN